MKTSKRSTRNAKGRIRRPSSRTKSAKRGISLNAGERNISKKNAKRRKQQEEEEENDDSDREEVDEEGKESDAEVDEEEEEACDEVSN